MIELIGLQGQTRGRRFLANAAPVRLGRQSGLEVVLSDAGVWDNHAEIVSSPEGWFLIRAVGQAHLSINDRPVREHRLCNGDVLGMGSAKLQFTLQSSPQRSLRLRENATWLLILAVVVLAVIVMVAIGR